jgi:hypothetical protein
MTRCILIAPCCSPFEIELNANDFHQLQAAVGGGFAVSMLVEKLAVMYHDEGLIVGLPANVKTSSGALLVGNLLVTRTNDAGDSIDTTPEDMSFVKRWLERDCSRPGLFEYDIPPMRVFTDREAAAAAGAGPSPRIVSVDGNAYEAR